MKGCQVELHHIMQASVLLVLGCKEDLAIQNLQLLVLWKVVAPLVLGCKGDLAIQNLQLLVLWKVATLLVQECKEDRELHSMSEQWR
jgi:hypothetical protein